MIIKPGGLLSVPGRGADKQDCVSSRLQTLYPEMIRQPAVHRLDMYTSGLMVYAITATAHRNLSMQFENRQVAKEYIALLEKNIEQDSGEINLAFRLDPDNRPLQVFDPIDGKIGRTLWQKTAPTNSEKNQNRLQFTPLTGRTHQLRVHSAHPLGLDNPIVGDSLYGSGKDGDEMMLCSTLLGFNHPETGRYLEFTIKPPY